MTHMPEAHAVRSTRHRPHPTTNPVSQSDVGIYTRTHLHLSDPLAGAGDLGLAVERHATHQRARDTLLHETDADQRTAALADAYEIFVASARLGSVHETATFALADLWTNGHIDALREALQLVDRSCTQHLQDGELWHAAKLARLGALLGDYAPEKTAPAWESRWVAILDQKGTLSETDCVNGLLANAFSLTAYLTPRSPELYPSPWTGMIAQLADVAHTSLYWHHAAALRSLDRMQAMLQTTGLTGRRGASAIQARLGAVMRYHQSLANTQQGRTMQASLPTLKYLRTLAGKLPQRRPLEQAALHNPAHRCARCDQETMRNALWRTPYTRAPAALRSQ